MKIIVVGENDVGKSSFIKKLCTKKFDEKSVSLSIFIIIFFFLKQYQI